MNLERKLLRLVLAIGIIASIAAPVMGDEYPGQMYGPFFIGSRIFTGSGVPSNGYGLAGDFYLNDNNGDYYNFSTGAWVLRGNLVGPAGSTAEASALILQNRSEIEVEIAQNRSEIEIEIWSNLSIVNTWIQINRSEIIAAASANDTAAYNWGPLILQNRSEIEAEILTNRSEILAAEHANRSLIEAEIWSNMSTVNDWILINRSEIIAAASANDTAGGSGPDGYSNLSIADLHISQNRSAIEVELLTNRSEILAAEHANRSQIEAEMWNNLSTVNDWILINRSEILAAEALNNTIGYDFGPLILQNRSEIESEIAVNRSQILAAVAANESAIDGRIWSNLSTVNNWILINRSEIIAAATANDTADFDFSPLILQNRSEIEGEIFTNRSEIFVATSTNLSLAKNISVMAQSVIPENGGGATVVAPNSTGMTGTARMHWIHLDFPLPTTSAGINASWGLIMPSDWSGGTLTLTPDWVSTGGTGTITWDWSGYCGDTLNSAYGTNVSATTTISTINTITRETSGATTMSGAPAASAMCWVQFRRLGGTLTTSGHLTGLRVAYGIS